MQPVPEDTLDPWTALGRLPSVLPPQDLDPHQRLRFALHAALTAPSPGNSQPWRLLAHGDEIFLFTDPTRALPLRDPDGQQRILAGGAALGLLRVALRALGLAEHTDTLPNQLSHQHPDLLARVTLTGSIAPTPEQTWLLQAIPKRRTHRPPLADRPVREALLKRLLDMAQETGSELMPLQLAAQRSALAARVDACLTRSDADPDHARERTRWPESGYEPFESTTGGPARGEAITEGSPLLALIITQGDDPAAWLRAGEAMIRVLLRGRVDHLQASFLPQPLARASDRWAVAEEAAVLGDLPQTPGFAQLALRLGYGGDLPAQPRRPLAEALLTTLP
jgi:hypothetical protein